MTAATCAEQGEKERVCTVCGYAEESILPLIAHTPVTDPALPAACEEEGKTEGCHCAVCAKILSPQSTIPALGHLYGEWTVENAATCANTGLSVCVCARCGKEEKSVLPILPHTPVSIPAMTPTCGKAGQTEGVLCAVCKEVLTAPEILPATGEHRPSLLEAVLPTCANTGLTEGSVCSVCGEILVPQTVLPKSNEHRAVIDPARSADCTHDGLSIGSHCEVCGNILIEQTVTEPKLGHQFVGGVCTRCGMQRPSPDECPHYNTCWKEITWGCAVYCSDCETFISEEEEHYFVFSHDEETCGQVYYTHYYCDRCGATGDPVTVCNVHHHYVDGVCVNCKMKRPPLSDTAVLTLTPEEDNEYGYGDCIEFYAQITSADGVTEPEADAPRNS